MNLRKLKRELKKQGVGAQRNRRQRFRLVLLILLLCILSFALTLGYRSYEQGAPERLFSKGVALEVQGRPGQALASYEQLFSHYSASLQAPEALFRAGRICRYDLRQDQQALFFFLQLENDYPESDYVAAAQLEAAELTKYRLRDFAQALVVYQRLLDQGTANGDRILFEIADCYFRLNNFSQARIEYDALLERFPESSLRAEVLYRRASALLMDGQSAAARAGFLSLIDSVPQSPYAVEARFSLAGMLEAGEQLKEALKAYRKLSDYPQQALLQEKIKQLEKRIALKKKAL